MKIRIINAAVAMMILIMSVVAAKGMTIRTMSVVAEIATSTATVTEGVEAMAVAIMAKVAAVAAIEVDSSRRGVIGL